MVRPHIGRRDRLRDKLFITLSQMTTLRGGISINDSLRSWFGEDVSEPLHHWHDNVVFWRELHLDGAQFLPFRFSQRTPVPRLAINIGINVEPQTNPAMLFVKSWPFGDAVPQRRLRRLSDFDQNVALSIKTLSNLDTACIMQPLDPLKSEYTIMWSRMVHPRFWCTLRLILCYECVICGFISHTYSVCFQHWSRRIQCLCNQPLVLQKVVKIHGTFCPTYLLSSTGPFPHQWRCFCLELLQQKPQRWKGNKFVFGTNRKKTPKNKFWWWNVQLTRT